MDEKQDNKIKKKKSILPKTAVKGLINGFISYGILLIFIFFAIVVLVTWIIENNRNVVNYNVLKYTLPILAAFLVYFLIRATCILSTFDLFKNCEIQKNEIDSVCKKMNLFYICVVAFSIMSIVIYLLTRFSNEKVMIARDISQYSTDISSSYAEEKKKELIEEYENNKENILIQTIIVEIGSLIGIFSLMPNQKKLIERYN